MQKINILISSDKNYICRAMDVLLSLRFHNECYLNVYLLYDSLDNSDIHEFEQFILDNNLGELHPVYFDSKTINLPIYIDYISSVTYFRLFFPFIVEDNIDRILYLDCDLICTGDILNLYNMDFDDNILMSCENMLADSLNGLNVESNLRLGLPEENIHINAGVLMVNIEKYRQEVKFQDLVDFINNNSNILYFQDQDVINKYFYGKIKIVDIKYNYQINSVDFGREINDYSIVHYSGPTKPWNYDYEMVNKLIPYYNFLQLKGDFETLEKLINFHSENFRNFLLRYYCDWNTLYEDE